MNELQIYQDPLAALFALPVPAAREALDVRWARLATDYATLRLVRDRMGRVLRDVGELLMHGHDEALADAERHVVLGYPARTGHAIDADDVDDGAGLDRWAHELDRSTAEGWGPPAPTGFWASFLRWRTPVGMARFSDRRRGDV